jgi:hypothetical protein
MVNSIDAISEIALDAPVYRLTEALGVPVHINLWSSEFHDHPEGAVKSI